MDNIDTATFNRTEKKSNRIDDATSQEPAEEGFPMSDNHEEVLLGYLHGWRLHFLTIGLCLSVFLSSLDITIVSTSLASIANDLRAFDLGGWIVSSYLITYFSFIIIWAKLSDIFGRKIFLASALVLFLVFSGACGGAQTILQLIIFRAFQGIGGAGIFSMTPAIISEMVPPERFAAYNALASSTIGISFLLGPLVGGAINDKITWRWIFYINLPVGVLALVLALVAIPARFPNHERPRQHEKSLFGDATRRIDFPGFFLFLSACLLLVCALQEAGTDYSWSSPLIISFLIISGVLWAAFLGWQRVIEYQDTIREAVFPWRFMTNRVLMGTLLTALFAGVPFTTIIIELPQRFQAVNGASSLNAGVRLLPYSLPCAVSSALTGAFTSTLKVPPIFVILVGTILQTVGLGLLYSLPISLHVSTSQYGFEALAGFGVGLTLTTLLSFAPFIVQQNDRAVALGGVTQLRVLGGAVGVSVATNLLNNHIKTSLSSVLPPSKIELILKSTQMIVYLDQATQERVRIIFAEGYNMGTGAVLGFTAAQFLSIVLMWEKQPRRIP